MSVQELSAEETAKHNALMYEVYNINVPNYAKAYVSGLVDYLNKCGDWEEKIAVYEAIRWQFSTKINWD